MPSLQILEREKPQQNSAYTGVAEAMAKGIELASDIQYKKGLIEYNKAKLANENAITQNEVEKAKGEREIAKWDRAQKVMDIGIRLSKKEGGKGIDPDKWGKYMTTVLLNDEELQQVFGSKELQGMIPSEDPKEAYQSASAEWLRSRMPSGGTATDGTNIPAINAISGGVPQAPEEDSISGYSVSPSGITINAENYGAQARGAALKTAATAQATREIEMQPIRESVGNYLSVFDNAVQEMGGLETSALAALAKGKGTEISAQIGNKPNVFTLGKLIEPVSLQLGSYLNKGRPTDKDQAAAKATLTRITYTKGANEILRNYLNTIAQTGNKELATKLFWSLAREGGSSSSDARAYGSTSMLSTKPATSRFTIREKK